MQDRYTLSEPSLQAYVSIRLHRHAICLTGNSRHPPSHRQHTILMREELGPLRKVPFTQRVLIVAIENHLIAHDTYFHDMKAIVDYGLRDPEKCSAAEREAIADKLDNIADNAISFHFQFLEIAKRLPGRKHKDEPHPESYITKKIRDTYLNWDNIDDTERQAIMRGFQIDDKEEDKARQLVKSYVLNDGDNTLERAFHDWMWDPN